MAASALTRDEPSSAPPSAQVALWPTERLTPYAQNARTHSAAQIAEIARSIEAFGMVGAIIVRHGTIAKGHGTLAAIRQIHAAGRPLYPAPGQQAGALPYPLGHVPVLDVHGWSDAQFRAYVLADNRIALNAGWDKALLALELQDLRALGIDMKLHGFSAEDLAAQRVYAAPEDRIPPPGKIPVSQAGDLWQLGPHRLLCGDARELTHLQQLMAGSAADLVWTDPPYNVGYDQRRNKANSNAAVPIAGDELPNAAFYDLLHRAFSAMHAVTKPGGCIYIAHADSEGLTFRNAMKDAGWMQKQCLIWVKNAVVYGRQDYNWKHEPILYGWKPGAGHYFGQDFTQQTVLDDDVAIQKMPAPALRELIKQMRNAVPSSVLREDRPHTSDLHPTMKPVALVALMLKNSSRENEIVLDGFGGSGTTLIAATKLARRARVLELDPLYADVIVRRWQEFTGENATLETTQRTFAEMHHARTQAGPHAP